MDYIIDEAYKLCVQFQYIFDMAAFQLHESTRFGELTFGSYKFCMAVHTAYAFLQVMPIFTFFLQLYTWVPCFCSWFPPFTSFSAVDTYVYFFLQLIPLLNDYDESMEKDTSLEKIGQYSAASSCESLDDAEALVPKNEDEDTDSKINPELTEVEVRL